MASEGDRAKALLTYANYAKVASALLVSRAAVADWAKGRSVTPYRLRQLEQLLRPDLQIEEAPPPEWARAMEQKLLGRLDRNMALIESLVPEEIRQAAAIVREQLRALPPPDVGTRNATPGAEGQGSEGSQAPGHASPPDQALGQ